MTEAPRLEARALVKRFGHVTALDQADLTVYSNEIVALVGDNGAGKSTLIKCLSGVIQPDEGEILLGGKKVSLSSPGQAQELGLETVYQDLALAPHLSSSANLFLGRERLKSGFLGKLGVLDQSSMEERTHEALEQLGIKLKGRDASIASLSGGQRQAVAIARAVAWASEVIFLDEPTAALGVAQRERVLELIERVRDAGHSAVLISHNMPEVLAIADRVEVFRLGRRVAILKASETTVPELVGAMTGAISLEESHAGD